MTKDWEKEYTDVPDRKLPEPAQLLKDYSRLFTGGKALDIASGLSQNAFFLSSSGYKVTAVDKSSAGTALAKEYAAKKGLNINAVEKDILDYYIKEESYDLIADFYFLERQIIPQIKKGLKINGLVFFETYTIDQQQINGPHNPDFLLKPNELINYFKDFFVIFYHERIERNKAIASLIAQKVDE